MIGLRQGRCHSTETLNTVSNSEKLPSGLSLLRAHSLHTEVFRGTQTVPRTHPLDCGVALLTGCTAMWKGKALIQSHSTEAGAHPDHPPPDRPGTQPCKPESAYPQLTLRKAGSGRALVKHQPPAAWMMLLELFWQRQQLLCHFEIY